MTTTEIKDPSDPVENDCLSVSIVDIMSKDINTVAEGDPRRRCDPVI
ncbi:MAG: hypothetical protein P1P69_01660 [Methanosarcinaceae archaeon]|nr:hypothetical protein [Methanosarcinaceae archaeon]MDF1533194.1 hypothetical protein [Methanosarcinaceae archaeon]